MLPAPHDTHSQVTELNGLAHHQPSAHTQTVSTHQVTRATALSKGDWRTLLVPGLVLSHRCLAQPLARCFRDLKQSRKHTDTDIFENSFLSHLLAFSVYVLTVWNQSGRARTGDSYKVPVLELR